VLLERMTTPEQQPVLHFWRTHPALEQLSARDIMEQRLAVREVLAPGLEAVIANHHNGRVKAVLLDEGDEAQLLTNFSQREPERGAQTTRARVRWLYGQWLKREAGQYGLPVIPVRPWDTIFERIIAALR